MKPRAAREPLDLRSIDEGSIVGDLGAAPESPVDVTEAPPSGGLKRSTHIFQELDKLPFAPHQVVNTIPDSITGSQSKIKLNVDLLHELLLKKTLGSEVVFNESVGSDMCGYYEPDAVISV
mmetsp:Transcript_52236/g.154179  ORF Transcript_52236/g.154179 Transcript_52236/m.154179 type:complete len:121 (+) Transcript_52236:203-565(+)